MINRIRKYDQLISSDVEFGYQFEAECLCKIIQVLDEELKRNEKEIYTKLRNISP